MIQKILLSLIIGVFCTIFALAYDQSIKTYIGDGFTRAFQETFNCHFSGTVESINFFCPRITFSKVCVKPLQDEGWHWAAQEYTTSFSWWHLLTKGGLDLHVYMKEVRAVTGWQNASLAIGPHLQKMFDGPPGMPIFLKVIDLQKATFELYNSDKKIHAYCTWDSIVQKPDDSLIVTAHVTDGQCLKDDVLIVKNLAGPVRLELSIKPGMQKHFNGQWRLSCQSSKMDNGLCDVLCIGSWNGATGECTFTADDTIHMTAKADISKNKQVHIAGQAPLDSLVNCFLPEYASLLQADATIDATVFFDDTIKTNSTIGITHATYQQHEIVSQAEISLKSHGNAVNGEFALSKDSVVLSGDFNGNLDTFQGMIHVTNSGAISFPFFALEAAPYSCIAQCKIQKDTLEGLLHGSLSGQQELSLNAALSGTLLQPILQGTLASADRMYVSFVTKGFKNIHACLDSNWLSTLVVQHDMIDLNAQGNLEINADLNGSCVSGTFGFDSGAVRIMPLYNCIRTIQGNFDADFQKNQVAFDQVHIDLDQGALKLGHGVLKKTGNTFFAQFPCILDNCKITLSKDIAATFTGNLCVQLQSDKNPLLSGNLIVEHSIIKGNIFSPMAYIPYISGRKSDRQIPEIDLDVTIASKQAMHIETAFLQTDVHIESKIQGNVKNPQVVARLQLAGGILHFPYKPLYISRGSLEFVPGALADPTIELVAKNTIHKHQITITVCGTLKNHDLILSSSPSLTHDQIVALLLIGADQESLPAAVPAALMDTLKHLFFDEEQSWGITQGYFRRMAETFAHVKFVPSFINQTARGGLRGALEIDIGQHWRALIEKNFSLTEDTRVELDYLLCDEITLKGVRDERRNVSGQVEMRLKF